MPNLSKDLVALVRTRCSWLITEVNNGRVSPERALASLDKLIGADAIKARQTSPKNPHEISVEDAVRRFHEMNSALNLDFAETEIAELFRTAPAWPDGKHTFRVIRARLDTGNQKVLDTFNMHLRCIGQTRELSGVWKNEDLRRTDFKLSLAAGNDTHVRGLSWAIVNAQGRLNLSANYQMPPEAVADEGLALAWQFPKYMAETAGLRHWLMGYEMHQKTFEEGTKFAKESDNEERQYALVMSFGKVQRKLRINNECLYPGQFNHATKLVSGKGKCFYALDK